MRRLLVGLCTFLLAFLVVGQAKAEAFITVASTTSTANSGLFDYLLPKFTEKTGIKVRVVAVGTGQAIRIAQNGDADVLFVHHRPSEEKFVAEGFGVKRYGVMYNDFVIVGPKIDPAGVTGCRSASGAMDKIAAGQHPFTSRGDDSGTHKREQSLWRRSALITTAPSGSWYRSTGSGMGATLNMAAAMDAYALADRGTWISFKNKQGLAVLCEGDPALFNPYGVILVNPVRHAHIKMKEGQAFIDWLISEAGQSAIGNFKLQGQKLFTPGTAH
jgi:tungstate transport system substrate-binding protein